MTIPNLSSNQFLRFQSVMEIPVLKGKHIEWVDHATFSPTFIDVFAGCGGLSLGLMRAGWQGLFAVEKDLHAFETLKTNFLQAESRFSYQWPEWLDEAPSDVEELLKTKRSDLKTLCGKVDLLAGGPPCQGFSFAGRRNLDDPRNKLVERYLEFVDLIKPKIVLIENVRGFTRPLKAKNGKSKSVNYSVVLQKALESNYYINSSILLASEFGVPQGRSRFFLIGFRKDYDFSYSIEDPFALLENLRPLFLSRKGIPSQVSAGSAISDLEVETNGTKPCPDTKGYQAINYKKPRTAFQRAMRDGFEGAPSDTRLAKHRPHIVERFEKIIAHCQQEDRLNTSLSKEMRESLGLKKAAIRVLDPKKPAPTLTSLPDDLLHYNEPRTLTVRENARLQTFPDWFVFKGKYTTGGDKRCQEVPRFTQVANAVPPLLAELFGVTLRTYSQ